MRQWTVDAFASRPFMGNPAAVVEPFDDWPPDDWMQALAEENKHAETAYLRRTPKPDSFELRWFTPAKEVELCGHATLASAHVLFAELELDAGAVVFHTRHAGRLGVERKGAGYRMDFPAAASTPVDIPEGLAATLGAHPVQVLSSCYMLVVLRDEASVRALTPDISGLTRLGDTERARGNVIVTARSNAGAPYQVVSRFFAPGSGIPEDPATGSAHCVLAPFWGAMLGRLQLDFHQAYPGRGADIRCEVAGDRVRIGGEAVTVMDSRLRL